ncbi:MAG: cytochrome c1 [Gammaproteobacteria bacterium]|nr:cytochrome c1 [Gammaproteobacteria bacterium]
MRVVVLSWLLVSFPALLYGATEEIQLQHTNIDLHDKASLKRGARIFVNYCLTCHSASYMRFNRVGRDLGLTDQEVKENLMFVGEKVGDTMEVAMRSEDAKEWFYGVAPPDLSVVARSRGPDWLFTYFLSFYLDPSRPTGVNNLVFENVAMPHVLWDLQGWQKPKYKMEVYADGTEMQVIERLELATPGSQTEDEYRRTVRDLTHFLVYLGEPARLERERVGPWVLLFLGVFVVVVYLLNKEYWKDVE